MKINENLFDLTPEQESLSKMMYNGNIIKCIIAPHHSYANLELIIPYTKNTFLFPEREMTVEQCRGLISLLASKKDQEFRIITTNMSIITDMIDGCVRILAQSGELHDCPCKTFLANIHTIRYDILESNVYKDKKEENNLLKEMVNKIISKLNDDKTPFTEKDYDEFTNVINLIGEPIIRSKLKGILGRKKVV